MRAHGDRPPPRRAAGEQGARAWSSRSARARALGARARLRRRDGPRLERRHGRRQAAADPERDRVRLRVGDGPAPGQLPAGARGRGARRDPARAALPLRRARQAAPLPGPQGGVLPRRLRARPRPCSTSWGSTAASRSSSCARRPTSRSTTASRTRSSRSVLERLRDVQTVVLPRTPRAARRARASGGFIVPERAIDAQSLVAFADLVVSAGGTMNREAVALGTPVYTTFEGRLGAVDEALLPTAGCASSRAPTQVVVEKRPGDARSCAYAGIPRTCSDCCSQPRRNECASLAISVNVRRVGPDRGRRLPDRGRVLPGVRAALRLGRSRTATRTCCSRRSPSWSRSSSLIFAAVRALLEALAVRRPARLRVDRQGGRGLELRADRRPLPDLAVGSADPPRGVIALDFLLTLAFVAARASSCAPSVERPSRGPLLAARLARGADRRRRQRRPAGRRRAAPQPRAAAARAIGFVDDDPRKQGMRVAGYKVLGTTDELPRVLDDAEPDEVIIAIPSAPGMLRQKVVTACRERDIPVRTLPTTFELLPGGVQPHAPGARGPGRGRARARAGARRDRPRRAPT